MDITVTLKCNNNCIFCPRHDYLKLIACRSEEEIFKDIKKTRKTSDNIVLSGGEVTILEDIWKIIGFCQKLNFRKIGIITNGRKLKDMNFAKRLSMSGVNDIAISIYSLNEAIHDRITQKKGSCSETKKGIINMLKLPDKYNISIRINLVLNFWNYKDIFRTLSRLLSFGIYNFTIAEQIILNKKARHLSYEKMSKFLRGIRQIHLGGVRLCLRGFAACFFNDNHYDSNRIILKKRDPFIVLETHEVNTLVKQSSSKIEYLRKFKKLFTKVDKCKNCFMKYSCPGIQKAYF